MFSIVNSLWSYLTKASTSNSPSPLDKPALSFLGPFGVRPCRLRNFTCNMDNHTCNFIHDSVSYLGIISPGHLVTLAHNLRAVAKIPETAHKFVWAYPPKNSLREVAPEDSEGRFILDGGFVYLDKDETVVGVNSISNRGGNDLLFHGPFDLKDPIKEKELRDHNRLQLVTIEALKQLGIIYFCWILPQELPHAEHGAFLYVQSNGKVYYFAVKGSNEDEIEIYDQVPILEWQSKDRNWRAFDLKSQRALAAATAAGEESVECYTPEKGTFTWDCQNSLICTKSGEKYNIRSLPSFETRTQQQWKYVTNNKSNSVKLLGEDLPFIIEKGFCKAIRTDDADTQPFVEDKFTIDYTSMVLTIKNDEGLAKYNIIRETPAAYENLVKRTFSAIIDTSYLKSAHGTIQLKLKDVIVPKGFLSAPLAVVSTTFSSYRQQTSRWNYDFEIPVSKDNLEGDVIITVNGSSLVSYYFLGMLKLSLKGIVEQGGRTSPVRQLCKEDGSIVENTTISYEISFVKSKEVTKEISPDEKLKQILENPAHFKTLYEMETKHASYQFISDIQRGSYAVVKEAIILNAKEGEDNKVAVKCIDRTVSAPEGQVEEVESKILQEIIILIQIKSDYCVSFIDAASTSSKYYIIMDYCDGFIRGLSKPDLCDAIYSPHMTESDIKLAVKEVILGLIYLHGIGICHRDIKPVNILYHSFSKHWKIADFGESVTFDPNYPLSRFTGNVGTVIYQAPEILCGDYDCSVDIWSTGVLAWEAFARPRGWTEEMILSVLRLKKDRLNPANRTVNMIDPIPSSPLAQQFVEDILISEPCLRPSLTQLLQHRWLID